MPLSSAKMATTIHSYPISNVGKYPFFDIKDCYKNGVLRSSTKNGTNKLKLKGRNEHIRFVTYASNVSLSDTSFPTDYSELLCQAKEATELAMKDNIQLMEIEFPTSGLQSVPGDGEGGIEMTGSMQLIREFCDSLVPPEKVTRTRIFFPEANEVKFARESTFGGVSFKLDYLTKPSFFEDFGFGTKVKMADRVRPEDELFLVGYPYFNVQEMLVVEELYKEAVVNTSRKLIVFNGELDRIRSGCILYTDLHVIELCQSDLLLGLGY